MVGVNQMELHHALPRAPDERRAATPATHCDDRGWEFQGKPNFLCVGCSNTIAAK